MPLAPVLHRSRGMRRILFPLLAAAALSGCASQTEYFRPTQAQSTGKGAFPSAAYTVQVQGRRVGDAHITSGGAFAGTLNGEKRTLGNVQMDVTNVSATPLVLEPGNARLQEVRTNEGIVASAPMSAVYTPGGGTTAVAPGAMRHFDMYFAMPPGIKPQHVDGFQLRWSVADPSGRYAQITPFTEDETTAEYVYYPAPYFSYYDPFWDPMWGFDPYYPPFPMVQNVRTARPPRIQVRNVTTRHVY